MEIRAVKLEDAERIADIYNYYIKETVVTFEECVLKGADIVQRIQDDNIFEWLVCERGGEVIGYAYASLFKPRASFRFTAETSIYLVNGVEGGGVGTKLYEALIGLLSKKGLHSAIGIIALPNKLSIGLHEKLGFEKAAHLCEVGHKFDRWVDVGHWQLML